MTVTTFLILLAASAVVVGSMVLFPLIDLAIEKKVKATVEESRHRDGLTAHDEPWQIGRPWFAPRSDSLRPDAVRQSQLTSDRTGKRAA